MSGDEQPPYPEPAEVPPYLPDGSPNPAWPSSYRDIAAKAAWIAYRAYRRAAMNGVVSCNVDHGAFPCPGYPDSGDVLHRFVPSGSSVTVTHTTFADDDPKDGLR